MITSAPHAKARKAKARKARAVPSSGCGSVAKHGDTTTACNLKRKFHDALPSGCGSVAKRIDTGDPPRAPVVTVTTGARCTSKPVFEPCDLAQKQLQIPIHHPDDYSALFEELIDVGDVDDLWNGKP